ncbi:MarR family transcriptional regulator [Microbacterium bovistercoris]|uniref:MarR family transcriptional regulator n=1 Tax=Microbacterium bovistercoris TaxID=2293570 RepID=A0A371NTX4_9MICO|nr:MarR family transcriptional regulator [Microbacterium bovistercoris]REJ05093.1 MarR family transcriptional regulator [Microbacterium bovistercoris]
MSSRSEVIGRLNGEMQVLIADAVLRNERIARTLGLNVVDLQAFGVLARAGRPLTAGELGQRTELPSSTTTRVIDRLEKQGLVSRISDPADRRRVVVQVDHEQLARISSPAEGSPYAEVSAHMDRVYAGFTLDELEVVARYFAAMNAPTSADASAED